MKRYSHRIQRPVVQTRHVGTDDRRRKQGQILKGICLGGPGSLDAGHGSFVEAVLAYLGEGVASGVGVIHAAVCTAIDESAAVHMRGEGEDIEGGDGVD